MTALADLRSAAWQAIAPPVRIDLDEWAERSIRLPSSLAAQPGPYRLYPYTRDIARSISSPLVERISIQKAARLGLSQLMVAGVGHFAANDPSSQLVVMPSDADALMLAKSILDPTFEASPGLRDIFDKAGERGADTLRERFYPGGQLSIVSGGSPKNLRARTARVLWIDEASALADSVGDEGDTIALAIKRTMTFGTARKIIMFSTPLDESTCRISRAFTEGDQRIWEVPCPHCETFTEIRWQHIQWPSGQPSQAYFCCPDCGAVTEEGPAKAAMVAKGRWRVTHPGITEHHSYRISALTSTMSAAAWGILADEFTKAGKDPHLLKAFVTLVLGEAWREDSEGILDTDLRSRCRPANLENIPEEIRYMVAGVDVQHDRIEISYMGLDDERKATILDHQVIWGNPFGDDLWLSLDVTLRQRWRHPLGGTIGLDRVLIDSGDGALTPKVYQFCMGRAGQGVFPLKGVSGWRQPPVTLGKAANKAVRLQLVGVDSLKRRLLEMVRAGILSFSDTLSDTYFDQFSSEVIKVRFHRGVALQEWHRIAGRRSETWDCAVYCLAATHLLIWNLDRRRDDLAAFPVTPKAPTVSRSKWLTGE